MTQGVNPNLWTQAQSQLAADLWQRYFVDLYGHDFKLAPRNAADRVYRRIAVAIGRPFTSVYYRFQNAGPTFGAMQVSPRKRMLSPVALTEAAARYQAAQQRDLTAMIFGDPPVGYSALDRKRDLNHRTTAV